MVEAPRGLVPHGPQGVVGGCGKVDRTRAGRPLGKTGQPKQYMKRTWSRRMDLNAGIQAMEREIQYVSDAVVQEERFSPYGSQG
jgi:hypothetical protein